MSDKPATLWGVQTVVKILTIIALASICVLIPTGTARADLINIQICADLNAKLGPAESSIMFPYSSGGYRVAQTFTPLTNMTIGGVKMRIVRDDSLPTGSGAINIWTTTFNGDDMVPDHSGGTLLASEAFDFADLSDRDILDSNYTGPLTCDYNDPNGIIVPFTNVENLYADTVYAIEVVANDANVGTVIPAIETTDYALGNGMAVDLIGGDPNDPNDWVVFTVDFEFVVYGATQIEPFETTGFTSTVDDWFDDWLSSINATDLGSKSFIIGLLALGIILSIIYFGGIGVIAAVIAFIFITSMAIMEYIAVGIAMTALLLVSFSAIVGLILLRRQGDG